MFFILVILGSFVYFYRDRFLVLFDTGISSGKDAIAKKLPKKESKNNKAFELIDLIEGITKKNTKSETNTEAVSNTKPELVNKTENKPEVKIVTKEAVKIQPESESEIKKSVPEKKVTEIKKNPEVKKNVEVKKIVEKPVVKELPKQQAKKIEKIIRKPVEEPQLKKMKIYLSKFDENSGLSLISTYRVLNLGDAPLTSTISALLKGPTSEEQNNDIITNVPGNTFLRSIYVKEGVAYIDLSENFENNPYGRESTVLQLKQIVYTATEFSSVKAVQFLINGKVKAYIGGDGVIISKPLKRNDFS